MFTKVKNEYYGYSTATYGDYVAVGDPASLRFNSLSSSVYYTGSVDVFQYNINTDQHVLVATLYKVLDDNILLSKEDSYSNILHTEPSGSDEFYGDKDIEIDEGLYANQLEDEYGYSLDINNDNILAVGCPYYNRFVQFNTSSFYFSGSGVDLYDLNKFDINQYINPTVYLNLSRSYTGSGYTYYEYLVPSGYNFVDFLGSFGTSSNYQVLNKKVSPVNGGSISFQYSQSFTPVSQFAARAYVVKDPYLISINPPDNSQTGSFGSSVSINNEWLAIGSPYVSSSKGMVYIYHHYADHPASWSFYQKLEPSDGVSGQLFGTDLELNKASGSFSGSLIVGMGRKTNGKAYLYELVGSTWTETYQFFPETSSLYPLQFSSVLPTLYTGSYLTASFANAVSIYGDTIVIGSPTDRLIYEYTGSFLYEQGAAYIFDKCDVEGSKRFKLSAKIYGNEFTLKNNRLGWSVDIFEDNIVIGIPKKNILSMDSCFLGGSLYQLGECGQDLENLLNGQWMYLSRNTSSLNWEINNVYQIKKKYLKPYRMLGYDVSIANKSIVVGAPIILSDTNREINLSITQSIDSVLDDITGKAYIYNLKNFKNEFYVGNVFYRNGKVVIMTSGSAFEGLSFNPISQYSYSYELDFKGKHTKYERQFLCTVNPGEFNVSTNPSAVFISPSVFDLNNNGKVDFQDIDILLRYMQYKNTFKSGVAETSWSSSLVTTDDERSFYEFYSQGWVGTESLFSSSFSKFESGNPDMESELDFNQDNKIDTNDLSILWKYFTNRLTQTNYNSFITPNSNRKLFSDVINYLDNKTNKKYPPQIKGDFFDYERSSDSDITGSYLSPFVTTIGLYDGLDLVGVAKLGSPIKLIPNFPINFAVKIDF